MKPVVVLGIRAINPLHLERERGEIDAKAEPQMRIHSKVKNPLMVALVSVILIRHKGKRAHAMVKGRRGADSNHTNRERVRPGRTHPPMQVREPVANPAKEKSGRDRAAILRVGKVNSQLENRVSVREKEAASNPQIRLQRRPAMALVVPPQSPPLRNQNRDLHRAVGEGALVQMSL
tara:strand:- start:733 stop:1263 length:531 start_codon:yes stop_codon:yes gene_type:complete